MIAASLPSLGLPSLALPSLRHLRMFEAVARLESLSRAAAEVNRSQPAVTQALANLEKTFGATLWSDAIPAHT